MPPDGQFPSVTQTPNPEVPASTDRALALSQSLRADIALATDPDADRLGAAVAGRSSASGEWPMTYLNGNHIAALLTHFKLAKLNELGLMPRSPIVVKTL